jgi:hypothetical protein
LVAEHRKGGVMRRYPFVYVVAITMCFAIGLQNNAQAFAYFGLPGNATQISSFQLTTPAGWDEVTWTDNPTQSYSIDIVNWDPGHTPSSLTDTNGSPVVTNITGGTSGVNGVTADIRTKELIKAYYNNPTQNIYYTFKNTNWTPGATTPSIAYSGLSFYSMP